MTAEQPRSGPERGPRGRSRRRRSGGKGKGPGDPHKVAQKEPSAVQVIKQAVEPERELPADAPLSPAEVAEMKRHFRFLQQHRKVLKLKANAQEDLLLNGQREPTTRGVCLHLLGKVELARVQSAAERMDPDSATKLLGGVVRFSPDVNYLLLFLQCVQKSQSRGEASAALAQALRHIEFSDVTPSQMRRVLELVVEVLPPNELPVALLSLLDSRTFRDALERSSEKLPIALSDIVLPLRAVHTVVVHGKKNPFSSVELARGCELLLGASESAVLELPRLARQRLAAVFLGLAKDLEREVPSAVHQLVSGFESEPRLHGELSLSLAAGQLRTGQEKAATRTLRALVASYPEFRTAKRWLEALSGQRVGSAILATAGQSQVRLHVPTDDVHVSAGWLPACQESVWVWRPGRGREADFVSFGAAVKQCVALSVARILEDGAAEEERPFLATSRARDGARPVARSPREVNTRGIPDVCRQGLGILCSLSSEGVALPDFALHRLVLDKDGLLFLENPWGLRVVGVGAAAIAHLSLGRQWVRDILGLGETRCLAPRRERALVEAGSCGELLRALDGW